MSKYIAVFLQRGSISQKLNSQRVPKNVSACSCTVNTSLDQGATHH
jgi:hypothetical protein